MQLKYHVVTIEDLVPENHVLRKVEAALDLSFIHEETAHLYSQKYGRPAIDPVVLVKYLLLGYLYGIPSERQIEERCRDSNAFRWYLGIDLDERVPDHSTISQLRRRKPKHPHRRVSRTDPDAGWLNRANKPHGMYDLSHQTLDTDHGIILDVAVTAGDAGDNKAR